MSPDDTKLVTLARASRARNGAAEGAAVRDLDGRTYAATTVHLDSLSIAALDLAVAMAVSSGAKGLEASAVVTDGAEVATAAVTDLGGADVPIFLADGSGSIRAELRS